MTTKKQHAFHAECIVAWYAGGRPINRQCPVCRRPFSVPADIFRQVVEKKNEANTNNKPWWKKMWWGQG
jgi:hypothetical protein